METCPKLMLLMFPSHCQGGIGEHPVANWCKGNTKACSSHWLIPGDDAETMNFKDKAQGSGLNGCYMGN